MITALAFVTALAIQDNSFLIEEAYNQESRVVQHIFTFARDRHGIGAGTFTQEWPSGGQRHQLSYTAPYARGAGDLLVNYRLQLIGTGESRVAVSPRISAILPTAHRRGIDINLPVSVALSDRVVTHWNAGTTAVRGEKPAFSAGTSVIWAAHPLVHLMLENRWASDTKWTVAPGVRWAHNIVNLQVVPGIAFPIGANKERSVFLYMSLEHPF